jgi:LmbE family N-acetylglucosaminyl deacetylase
MKKRKILVISPHSDDSEYGMGGTIINLLKEGAEVHVFLIVATTVDFVHKGGEAVGGMDRVREFGKCINFYGARGTVSGDIWKTDDNSDYEFGLESRLDSVPIRDVINAVERKINVVQPDEIYIPCKSHHQDHRVVYEASLTACRPTQRHRPKNIFLYEIPTSDWGNTYSNHFQPTTYHEIDIQEKIELCKTHESQLRDEGSYLGMRSIDEHARYRGRLAGCACAEAFQLILSVNIKDD